MCKIGAVSTHFPTYQRPTLLLVQVLGRMETYGSTNEVKCAIHLFQDFIPIFSTNLPAP